MKKSRGTIVITSVILSMMIAYHANVQADEEHGEDSHLMKQSRQAAKELGKALKKTLKASMKKKGPIESIEVCNLKAPELGKKISSDKGMRVGRTSLKYRNSNNKPDRWEARMLQMFEKKKQQGVPIKKLEYGAVMTVNGQKVYRYMKAIGTDDVCLTCHGRQISPELATKIRSLYPQDKATGFSKGDIRGAFTVTRPL